MEKRFAKRKGKLVAAAVGAVGLMGLGTSQADASLIIDVRTLTNTKSITATSVGQVIVLNVFAQVSGTDGNNQNEWLQSIYGSFSTVGTLKANSVPSTTSGGVNGAIGWNASGFQNGSSIDFDSDGDLDLGSAGTASDGKFFARQSAPESLKLDQPTTTTDPDTMEVVVTPGRSPAKWAAVDANTSESKIGTVRLVVADLNGSTLANFLPRRDQPGALWWQDTPNPTSGPVQHDGLDVAGFNGGTPVTIAAVPEPASLGLMGLAGLGLLKRRRNA